MRTTWAPSGKGLTNEEKKKNQKCLKRQTPIFKSAYFYYKKSQL